MFKQTTKELSTGKEIVSNSYCCLRISKENHQQEEGYFYTAIKVNLCFTLFINCPKGKPNLQRICFLKNHWCQISTQY